MALEKVQGSDVWQRVQRNFDAVGERGTYTCVDADATANLKDIVTGKTDATAFIVQIMRANVNVTGDAVITLTTGTLRVADGSSTYTLTTGDKINWIVF